ncbi:hypothetical protein ACWGJT_22675 [Streptomyces xantholiticus]
MTPQAFSASEGNEKHRLDSAYRTGEETAGRSPGSIGKPLKDRTERADFRLA